MSEESQVAKEISFKSFLNEQLKPKEEKDLLNKDSQEDFQLVVSENLTNESLIELITNYFGPKFKIEARTLNHHRIIFHLKQNDLEEGLVSISNYSDTPTKSVFVTVKFAKEKN